jgi:hypothetical protein
VTADEVVQVAAEAAARRLNMTAVSDDLLAAAWAAYRLAWSYMLGEPTDPDDPESPTELPYDESIAQGLIVLAVRVHKDPESPAGVLSNEFYAGTVSVPEDLMRHVHYYFDHGRDMSRVVGIG